MQCVTFWLHSGGIFFLESNLTKPDWTSTGFLNILLKLDHCSRFRTYKLSAYFSVYRLSSFQHRSQLKHVCHFFIIAIRVKPLAALIKTKHTSLLFFSHQYTVLQNFMLLLCCASLSHDNIGNNRRRLVRASQQRTVEPYESS